MIENELAANILLDIKKQITTSAIIPENFIGFLKKIFHKIE